MSEVKNDIEPFHLLQQGNSINSQTEFSGCPACITTGSVMSRTNDPHTRFFPGGKLVCFQDRIRALHTDNKAWWRLGFLYIAFPCFPLKNMVVKFCTVFYQAHFA